MKRVLITVFIVVILGALALRLSQDLERYQKTVARSPSRKALEDPYLAFRRWAGMNRIVLSEAEINTYMDYDTVLLNIQRDNTLFSLFGINQWIEGGGHLFVICPAGSETTESIEIMKKMLSSSEIIFSSSESAPSFHPDTQVLMSRKGEEGRVSVYTNRLFHLETIPDESLFVPGEEDDSYSFVSMPFGAGRITLSGVPAYMENDLIGEADNATLIWRLLGADDSGNRILFLIEDSGPSRAGKNPWGLLIAASWLIGAALVAWAGSRRPDSPLESGPAVGSDIGLRLAAEGEFLRRHHGTAVYVAAGRTAAMRKLRRRGWKNPGQISSIREIARRMGHEESDLILALGEHNDMNPGEYLRVMKIFHQIEAEL